MPEEKKQVSAKKSQNTICAILPADNTQRQVRDMARNSNLHAAKTARQDEFYTRYQDIQAELDHYKEYFEGKTAFCNCDDPFESNFCRFFP